MAALKVYLAGPNVFFPNHEAVFKQQKAICAQYGFEGVAPTDNQPDLRKLDTPHKIGLAISKADEDTMNACDLVIANMTPWPVKPDDKRQLGISTDVGTAYEMGYMRAQGKPVFAYTNTSVNFLERTKAFLGGLLKPRASDPALLEDKNGFMVDNTAMHDNLMLDGGVHHSGGAVVAKEVAPENRFNDLSAFEEAVKLAAKTLKKAKPDKAD